MENLELAEKIVECTGSSLFLTGKAGTGKTTFLRRLREKTRKRMVVAAPTGIAAINAGGVTLHSFFQLEFGPYVPGIRKEASSRGRLSLSKEKIKIIRGMDLLVIDEVSMVRSDMLDAVDAVLRRYRDRNLPFGGVQLLLIGDLQQLPPVVKEEERALLSPHYRSPYFFDSHALNQVDYVTVELQEVFRQNDARFVDLLNAVRENKVDEKLMEALNSRYIPGFRPSDAEGYVRLTTHNHLADRINSESLGDLPGKGKTFTAKVTGKFPESSFPADRDLRLKENARVMFIKNDTGGERRFYNGMLATVTSLSDDCVTVTTSTGEQIEVDPAVWENKRYAVDETSHELKEETEGTFSQLPLRLAWGITIHKSQGLTFDRAIVDASGSFSHGQTYVALSRCRTLEGLVLSSPLSQGSIITDNTVGEFMRSHAVESVPEDKVSAMERAYELSLMEGMFEFRPIFNALEGVVRLLQENFMRLFPKMVENFRSFIEEKRKSMVDVGDKFRLQVRSLVREGGIEGNAMLRERIQAASVYFGNALAEIDRYIGSLSLEHDNRKVAKKMEERLEMYRDLACVRAQLLKHFASNPFSIRSYLDIKASGALSHSGNKGATGRSRKSAASKDGAVRTVSAVGVDPSEDNRHPALFEELRSWRAAKAREEGMPAYIVASTKSLVAVANCLPRDYESLTRMPGFGAKSVKWIGDEVLDIVEGFIAASNPEDLNPLPLPAPKRHKLK